MDKIDNTVNNVTANEVIKATNETTNEATGDIVNVVTNNNINESVNVRHKLRISKENLLKSLIPTVLRQTDYTEEQATEKLESHNFDLKALLYEYMGIPLKKDEKPCATSNQERYRLIRNTMDISNKFG